MNNTKLLKELASFSPVVMAAPHRTRNAGHISTDNSLALLTAVRCNAKVQPEWLNRKFKDNEGQHSINMAAPLFTRGIR